MMGYGPERFQISGDTAIIGVRENESLVQKIVDHAKNYVTAANRGYVERERERLAREDRAQRAALEKQVAEAELRKNILSRVKL